ncbi:MAG: hypothetical protein KBD40_12180 [Phenylobacterium sp.]|nr:hypothetical protein [Phenylobacterium sp.]
MPGDLYAADRQRTERRSTRSGSEFVDGQARGDARPRNDRYARDRNGGRRGIGEQIVRGATQFGQGVVQSVLPMAAQALPQVQVGGALRTIGGGVGMINRGAGQSVNAAANAIDPLTPAMAAIPYQQPENMVERNAARGGRLIPNAAAPGSLLARGLSVAVPYVLGALGRQFGGDTGEVVGELAGGVALGIRPSGGVRAARNRFTAPASAFRHLERGGADAVDVPAMRTRQAEYTAAGIEPTVVDLTNDAGRGVFRAAASLPTGGRTRAREFNTQRNVDVQTRVPAQARRILSPDDARTPERLQTDIETARETHAATDYAPAYAEQIPVTPDILDALSGQPGQNAIRRALTAAVSRRDYELADELRRLHRASLQPSAMQEVPTVSGAALDRIQIAYGRQGARYSANQGGDIASGLFGRRESINQSLDGVPGLAPARARYADLTGQIDAVDTGQGFLVGRNGRDQFVSAVEGMTPDQLKVARTSAANLVDNQAGGSPTAALSVADQLSLGQNQQAATSALVGPEQAATLARNVSLESGLVRNAQDTNPRTGSQTQLNQQGAANLAGTLRNGIQMARGDFLGPVIEWLGSLGINPQEAEQFVRAGMDPAQTEAFLSALEARGGPGAAASFIQFVTNPRLMLGVNAAAAGANAQANQQQ